MTKDPSQHKIYDNNIVLKWQNLGGA